MLCLISSHCNNRILNPVKGFLPPPHANLLSPKCAILSLFFLPFQFIVVLREVIPHRSFDVIPPLIEGISDVLPIQERPV